jgi:hypothetical protein
MLLRLEKQTVISILSLSTSLLEWTHFQFKLLNYEMLPRLMRASDAGAQLSVLAFWHTWITIFASG